MMSGKNQSSQSLTAYGSMMQASTYGLAIPTYYGCTTGALLAIWAGNFRQGGSVKKFKQMKKGMTAYCENITFLIGTNPILSPLQFWVNNGKYPLNFVTQTFTGPGPWTITDSHFYAVIGVSITQPYSESFNDYGGGPQSVSGNFEVPLWNELIAGPDPTGNSAYRNWPYCYRWQPSYGAVVQCDASDVFTGATVTVYYAQLSSATLPDTPISKLRMHFEAELGNGDEYDGNVQGTSTPLSTQQILYPWYNGCGSASLDLGSSGAIPSITPEMLSKFAIYPRGDCDFVDIIEDILKSGMMQSAIGGALGYGPIQTGVGLYDLPGCVQQKCATSATSGPGPIPYNMPTTAGNFLVVVATSGSGTLSILDSGGNTWTPVFASGLGYQVWHAQAIGGASTVTVTDQSAGWGTTLLEVAGLDTFDNAVVGTTASLGITTSNASGYPGYLLAIPIYTTGTVPDPVIPAWDNLTPPNIYGNSPAAHHLVQERRIANPGTYTITEPVTPAGLCLLAFKCAQPPTYPKPLLDILDQASADLTRLQCRAGGLWGSLVMNSQQACSDWLKSLVQAANCAPVWSGFRLKLIPMSEASAVGNGAVYISPTAGGAVANLDADHGDFIGDTPVTIVRMARTDLSTVLQMQHINRNSDYAQIVTAVSDPASIALYGVRKADPVVNNAVQDVAVAMPLLRIMVRRKNYVENVSYQFKLNARYGALEPMDLVTVTDREQGIFQVPVRLTSVEEDDQFALTCEAEPFIYGLSAPQTLAVTNPTPYRPSPDASADDVNPPVIFEPVVRMYGAQNQQQLWLVVSSPSILYGGCQVMISTDGGLSYNSAGDPIMGNGTTGATVGAWAAAASPDTINDLAVDLTECLGVLASFQTSDEDNFVYPCYVAGTSTPIPYELMTYAVATMTAANKYTLKATGSGNHLDRGVFGAPVLNAGAAHASGSRFAFLSPDGTGILKMTMDPLWIGKTLYFKFLSFNTFGGGLQQLADVTAYPYTPTGGSGAVNPTGLPVTNAPPPVVFLDTVDNVTRWQLTVAGGAPVFTKVTTGVGVSGLIFADVTGLVIGMTVTGGAPVYTVLSSGFGPSLLNFVDTVDSSQWSLSFNGGEPVYTLV